MKDETGNISFVRTVVGEFEQVDNTLDGAEILFALSSASPFSSSSKDIMCVCTFFRIFKFDVDGSKDKIIFNKIIIKSIHIYTKLILFRLFNRPYMTIILEIIILIIIIIIILIIIKEDDFNTRKWNY